MKLLISLQIIFVCYFPRTFGQDISADSLTKNLDNKVHVGIYFMPTYSMNIGKEVVPGYSDPVDCNCAYKYRDLSESGGIGYNFGLEIESNKISKRISFSGGINIEIFNYYGTAISTYYNVWAYPQFTHPYSVKYSYRESFLNFPVLVNYALFNNNSNRLNILAGASVGLKLSEKNVVDPMLLNSSVDEYYWSGSSSTGFFAKTGIEYFFGKGRRLNIGFVITLPLNSTPYGRKLAAAGFRVGTYF